MSRHTTILEIHPLKWYIRNVNTITIPKNLIRNDDLVVLPRKEYERLFRFWANAEAMSAHTKKAIEKGFREIARGEFVTSKQLKDELGL